MTHCNKIIPLALPRVKWMLGHRHSERFVCFWKPAFSWHKMWWMFYFREIQIKKKTLYFLLVPMKILTWFTHCITVLEIMYTDTNRSFLFLGTFISPFYEIHPFFLDKTRLLLCIHHRRKHQSNLNCADPIL